MTLNLPKSGMSFFLFMRSNRSASGPDQKNIIHVSITQAESFIVKYIYLLHVQYNLQLAVPKKGTKVFPTEYFYLTIFMIQITLKMRRSQLKNSNMQFSHISEPSSGLDWTLWWADTSCQEQYQKTVYAQLNAKRKLVTF